MNTEQSNQDDNSSSAPIVSVSATDLFGIGRGLDALMRALRAGIGPAFEPLIHRRLASADQEAARGWLKLTKRAGLEPKAIDIETVDGRSKVRLIAEAQIQQQNREAIADAAIVETRALISDGTVPKEDIVIEPEWLSRYWRLAQDVSNEELQSLWARVLAREATGVGTVSARTLKTLATLSRKEADELVRIAPFCCTTTHGGIRTDTVRLKNVSDPTPPGQPRTNTCARFSAIQERVHFDAEHFGGIGICIESSYAQTFTLTGCPDDAAMSIAGKSFSVAGVGRCLSFASGDGFTAVGREILDLIKTEPDGEFVRLLRECFEVMGLQLEPL
jgi:hypothetical protein